MDTQFRRYVLEHCNAIPAGVARVTINQTTVGQFTVTVDDPFGIIDYIRRNSHRYLAKRTADGIATICRLNDRNSYEFWDGTAAALNGTMGDCMRKIDVPFYYRFPNGDNPDLAVCEFTLYPTAGFYKWWPNWLMGAFEAQLVNNKMYSRAGVAVSNNYTQPNGESYAEARGTGYTMDIWEMHTVTAWLFYAMYAHMNSQACIGYGDTKRDGTVAYKNTGQTASLGMIDTVGELGILKPEFQLGAVNQGNKMSINFWGLENWWGNYLEWFGDAKALTPGSANLTVWVPDPNTGLFSSAGATRVIPVEAAMIQNSSTSWGSVFIERMLIGDHGDLVNAKATISGTQATQDTCWCDTQAHTNINDSMWAGNAVRTVRRSSYLAYPSGGVAYTHAAYALTVTSTAYGGRLAFSGETREAASVADFVAAQEI